MRKNYRLSNMLPSLRIKGGLGLTQFVYPLTRMWELGAGNQSISELKIEMMSLFRTKKFIFGNQLYFHFNRFIVLRWN